MKSVYIILLVSCLTIFILDAATSVASRRFNFNYARLAPLSFIIYAASGFLATLASDQASGIIVAAAVGFFDATAGWKISMQLNANTGEFHNNPSTGKWISTAIFVTLLAAVCGLAGSILSNWIH